MPYGSDPLPAKVRAARILKFLTRNGISTVRQIANYLGNVKENRLYRVLSDMKRDGLILHCGWTKGKGHSFGRTAKLYKASDNVKVKELVEFLI